MKIAFLGFIVPLVFCQCAKEEAPPVGMLKTTTHEFVLHAGSEGTLYTVRDGSGREIVTKVSAGELAARFPELSENLKSLYAGSLILESKFRNSDPRLNRIEAPTWKARPVEASSIDLPAIPDLRTTDK